MPRAVSHILGPICLALIPLGLTGFLFFTTEEADSRSTLLIFLLTEVAGLAWLTWQLTLSPSPHRPEPIRTPLARPSSESLPPIPNLPPRLRPVYIHRALQPSRPPQRCSDPIPAISKPTPSLPRLPPLPDLTPPQPGRSNTRTPEPTPRPATPKPIRPPIRLDDLLPASSTVPKPVPVPPPSPQPAPAQTTRPKRPKRFASFNHASANIPSNLNMVELKICSEILSLGYACAASDGPVTSEEDNHLLGWMWCFIENTVTPAALAFQQGLTEVSDKSKMQGKQRLTVIESLGKSIRASGDKKLIQAAAALCTEIIELDQKLELGEFATLATALQALGQRPIKATKIAQSLLRGDEKIENLSKELGINESTPKEKRELIISREAYRCNQRASTIKDHQARKEMLEKMNLILKIGDLYRELENPHS